MWTGLNYDYVSGFWGSSITTLPGLHTFSSPLITATNYLPVLLIVLRARIRGEVNINPWKQVAMCCHLWTWPRRVGVEPSSHWLEGFYPMLLSVTSRLTRSCIMGNDLWWGVYCQRINGGVEWSWLPFWMWGRYIVRIEVCTSSIIARHCDEEI